MRTNVHVHACIMPECNLGWHRVEATWFCTVCPLCFHRSMPFVPALHFLSRDQCVLPPRMHPMVNTVTVSGDISAPMYTAGKQSADMLTRRPFTIRIQSRRRNNAGPTNRVFNVDYKSILAPEIEVP